MSSFMDSTAWQEVRTYSVLVLVINNKSQLLLFLQAGPIMEEKPNKMWPLSLRVSRFQKGKFRTPGGWDSVLRWGGMKVQEYGSNREGGDPSTTQDTCSCPQLSLGI